jgi:very-short-patch-repair endonuclease
LKTGFSFMEYDVDRYIQELRREADEATRHAELVASAFKLCGSPIERRLLLAYLQQYPAIVQTTITKGDPDTHVFVDKEMGSRWVSFVPQLLLSIKGRRFRPDFLFMQMVEDAENSRVISVKNVVVEVDGHDFHERTKEQARRDRSRDRLMLRHDFYVLRYTGSEVFKDAEAVAREIREFVMPAEVAA